MSPGDTPRSQPWTDPLDRSALQERLARAQATAKPHDRSATARAELHAEYCGEPALRFAGDRLHVDPKTGIARFGPASLGGQHPLEVRLGYVGSGRSLDAARRWFHRAEEGVTGDPVNKLPDFPGCTSDRGFFTRLVHDDRLERRLTTHEIGAVKAIRTKSERFDAAVALVSEQVKLIVQQDQRPDLIVLALPDELLEHTKNVKYNESGRGLIARDFRRSLKAELMRYGTPTQIVRQRTTEAGPGDRKLDHASRVAWNMFTSVFYKGGGVPWKPSGLRPDTCYIGVSFHRPVGSSDTTLRSSVAQAFDEHGAGLVLRGPDFQWSEQRDGKSPHLNAEQSAALLRLVLERYRAETQRLPARVVVHKTSRFFPEEREGFAAALQAVPQFDLVAVAPTSEVRLLRAGQYPALRGTLFRAGDNAYLYTTGYIPALQAYPHGHIPSPLQIADHHGDSSLADLAKEILILTKMNWNSAGFAGALPITIRFSRLVGDIMREIPSSREPQPQFKYYI